MADELHGARAPGDEEEAPGVAGETKAGRFRRLANQRGKAVIKRLDLLSNLSNTGSYEFTAEQVEKLFGAIDEHVRNAREGFDRALSRRSAESRDLF